MVRGNSQHVRLSAAPLISTAVARSVSVPDAALSSLPYFADQVQGAQVDAAHLVCSVELPAKASGGQTLMH